MVGIGLLVAAVGCGSNPAAPAAPGGGSTGGTSAANSSASIGPPRPLSPGNLAQIKYADQPITLVAANAITTAGSGTTYTFEIASDAAFASKFQTKDAVAEGANGQTSVRLDTLPGSSDYYWHVRATGGGTSGVFGTVYHFTLGPAITLGAPTAIAPLTGTTATTLRPTLRVLNAAKTGTNNPTQYRFDISTSATFTPLLNSGTVNEGNVETDFIPSVDLPQTTSLFWRATAIDAPDSISSSPSVTQSFGVNAPPSQAEIQAAKLGVKLWPGIVPPGTVGHATMGQDAAFGSGWDFQTLFYAPGNVTFPSPDIEMLRIFDLLDRGFDPANVSDWMNSNGYPTAALWYPGPEKAVIGLKYVYLAARGKVTVNGTWDIVVRSE
jgi:hypothetical protein